jgi:hypothetical protein
MGIDKQQARTDYEVELKVRELEDNPDQHADRDSTCQIHYIEIQQLLEGDQESWVQC